MLTIIQTEFIKIKRHSILLIGVSLMALCVLMAVYFSTATESNMVWDLQAVYEQVTQTAFEYLSPACIALILGRMIDREWKDDTLKSVVTVPVSLPRLVIAKLFTCSVIMLVLGAVCGVFSLIACQIAGFPGLTLPAALRVVALLAAYHFLLFWAVAPVALIGYLVTGESLAGVILAFVYGYIGQFVVSADGVRNLYPVLSCLGILRFREQYIDWNYPLCYLSFAAMVLLSIGLSFCMKKKDGKPQKKKKAKLVMRKSW